MIQPGRNNTPSAFRNSFQNQQTDDEILGVSGSLTTAEFWEYDTRLGRRWNMDPVTTPWQSQFTTFNNNPNIYMDPSGAICLPTWLNNFQHFMSNGAGLIANIVGGSAGSFNKISSNVDGDKITRNKSYNYNQDAKTDRAELPSTVHNGMTRTYSYSDAEIIYSWNGNKKHWDYTIQNFEGEQNNVIHKKNGYKWPGYYKPLVAPTEIDVKEEVAKEEEIKIKKDTDPETGDRWGYMEIGAFLNGGTWDKEGRGVFDNDNFTPTGRETLLNEFRKQIDVAKGWKDYANTAFVIEVHNFNGLSPEMIQQRQNIVTDLFREAGFGGKIIISNVIETGGKEGVTYKAFDGLNEVLKE